MPITPDTLLVLVFLVLWLLAVLREAKIRFL